MKVLILAGALILTACGEAHAQTQPVAVSGQLNISTETYSSKGIPQRRARNSSRLILRPTVTVYDQIVLPFEVYVTNDDRGIQQPFNQFGASPTFFGWLTLHGGYFSTTLTDLTFGDTRILGGGVQATPGRFRFAALYGRTQQAIAPDSTRGFRGVYERTVLAGKLGYGDSDGFHLDLHFMRMADDSTSIPDAPSAVSPKENVAASLATGFPLFGRVLTLKAELAVAALSTDTRARELSDVNTPFKSLFTPRTSSQIDGAATLALRYVPSPVFSLGVGARWVGPGYVTLGYEQMPNDVLDVTVTPAFRLLENRLTLRTTAGLRVNNLRNNRLATTRRTLANLSGSYQPTQAFGIDVTYSNYGMRSAPRNDTLRVDNISQSLMLSPRYAFEGLGGMHTIFASYALQDFTDHNVVTSVSNNTTTSTISGGWSLAFPSSLNFVTSYTHTRARTSVVTSTIQSVSETIGYSLLENALTLSGTIGYNIVKTLSSDGQVMANLSASYSLGRGGVFTLTLMTNRYDDRAVASGTSYSETQGSLLYSYTF